LADRVQDVSDGRVVGGELYYYPWNTCIPDFWREHEWETEYDQS